MSSPHFPKKALREFSSVLKSIPWTKSSVFPACSSSTAGVSSSFFSEADSSSEEAFFGFSSESESEPLELSFLAAAFFFGAGLASEESLSSSEELSFLAAFLAGAAFLTGLASDELSESELDSTLVFFCAIFWLSLVLAAFLELLLLALDSALGLLATTFFGSEESESLSSEDDSFLTTFLDSFLDTSFWALFLVLSMLVFLDGASDELADATFFYKLDKKFVNKKHSQKMKYSHVNL